MVAYYPWNETNLSNIIKSFQLGKMPVLDLEFSALCKHRLLSGGCIYCDSPAGKPHYNELRVDKVKYLMAEACKVLDLRWLYCCGLGEPSDDPKFKSIVEFSKNQGITLSVFSNGIGYTQEFINFLYKNDVCLLIKCDSLDAQIFSKSLGASDVESANSIYRTLEMALNVGYGKDVAPGMGSRLALSIVPTQLNKYTLIDVVRFCKANNLFPLLGQLEQAGRGENIFEDISLSNAELQDFKEHVDDILGFDYKIPVCPAGIAGLHIDNIGQCVVHEETGLSCAWFDLENPTVNILGNINDTDIVTLWNKVLKYRKDRLNNLSKKWIEKPLEDIFGGCGGADLVKTYLQITSEISNP